MRRPSPAGRHASESPSQLLKSYGVLIFLFPILTAAFQFVQSKMMVPPATKDTKIEKKTSDKKTKDKEKPADDFATAFQSQSLYLLPLIIGFTSYNFPIGLSLYWNTFTIFGIIQQYRIAGWGGLESWIQKIRSAKSEIRNKSKT